MTTKVLPDTRKRLIAAASELFAERGFHGTKARDIAARAGVNLAAGNYHYGSKKALYLEVLRAHWWRSARAGRTSRCWRYRRDRLRSSSEKLVPFVGLAYGVFLFATIASGVFFGIWPEGSWFALIVVTLPFVLASLAIGVFVSTLAHTSAQAVFITVFFIMPSFVLSGSMFPYQLMPHGVREVGALFPLRWYQIAARRIIDRGAGLTEVVVPMLALIMLFGVILAGIRWRMKPRLG